MKFKLGLALGLLIGSYASWAIRPHYDWSMEQWNKVATIQQLMPKR